MIGVWPKWCRVQKQSMRWVPSLFAIVSFITPVMSFAGVEEDIQKLHIEMQEIKKDVREIKNLLQSAIQKQPPMKTTATVKFTGSPMQGYADAPVTIIEFSDYQCPYCKRFASTVFPTLKHDYIDTGKVRYVFRDFPLTQIHPQAAKAHEGAHCAGEQDRYWDMHELLFQNQKDLSVPSLSRYAAEIGIDVEAFETCLEKGKHGAAIQLDIQAGAKAGVRGTPSFIIGKSGSSDSITGTIVRGAQPLAKFRQVIESVQKSLSANQENSPFTR